MDSFHPARCPAQLSKAGWKSPLSIPRRAGAEGSGSAPALSPHPAAPALAACPESPAAAGAAADDGATHRALQQPTASAEPPPTPRPPARAPSATCLPFHMMVRVICVMRGPGFLLGAICPLKIFLLQQRSGCSLRIAPFHLSFPRHWESRLLAGGRGRSITLDSVT